MKRFIKPCGLKRTYKRLCIGEALQCYPKSSRPPIYEQRHVMLESNGTVLVNVETGDKILNVKRKEFNQLANDLDDLIQRVFEAFGRDIVLTRGVLNFWE